MKKILITGCGLITPFCNSLQEMILNDKHEYPLIHHAVPDYNASLKRNFRTKKIIEREDRSVLGVEARSAIDVTHESFTIRESVASFSADDKENMPIYICNEPAPHIFDDYERFMGSFDDESDEAEKWQQLGRLKDVYNPLDMLRILSTNALYHISKVFNLRGGGYPIRRMSLSSLCAFEEAFYDLKQQHDHALVVANGNLTMPENYCYFERMGMIRHYGEDTGIIPSFGSASVIMERKSTHENAFAEVIDCKTIFHPTNDIDEHDWECLFKNIPQMNEDNLVIISYDNGNENVSQPERNAIETCFPHVPVMNYKKFVGYTGKSNNLIDLVMAIADNNIDVGKNILVNGFGDSSGIGYILVKKIAQMDKNQWL